MLFKILSLGAVFLLQTVALGLPPYLTDFQSPYPEDFNTFLRPEKRFYPYGNVMQLRSAAVDPDENYVRSFNRGEHPKHEGDFREKVGQTPGFYDLDPRSEYADSNLLKALNGEKMKVTGGNGANGAYNLYPASVVPGHTEKTDDVEDDAIITEIGQELADAMESGNSPGINPYPTPPNPCPLPYPDEEGKVRPYTDSDGCIPKWRDDASLSRWFQNQQVGKSDEEHNQGIDKGHVKKEAQLPYYLKAEDKRDSIQMKKG